MLFHNLSHFSHCLPNDPQREKRVILVVCRLCMCLQCTFSHPYDISADQGLAPYQDLDLQSVTMPTTPVPAWTHHSSTCLKMALWYMAEQPALKKLPNNLSVPQLHPHTAAGQLYSEGQRVQLQGLWAHSWILKTHPYIHSLIKHSSCPHTISVCCGSRCLSLTARMCHLWWVLRVISCQPMHL